MVADTDSPEWLDSTARTIGPLRHLAFQLFANSGGHCSLIIDNHLLNISKATVPLQTFEYNGSRLYLPSWEFLTVLVTILLRAYV